MWFLGLLHSALPRGGGHFCPWTSLCLVMWSLLNELWWQPCDFMCAFFSKSWLLELVWNTHQLFSKWNLYWNCFTFCWVHSHWSSDHPQCCQLLKNFLIVNSSYNLSVCFKSILYFWWVPATKFQEELINYVHLVVVTCHRQQLVWRILMNKILWFTLEMANKEISPDGIVELQSQWNFKIIHTQN
jgi:hypothetical protein